MSFLSWLRDFLTGADNSVALEHGRAAARFRAAKQFERAREAYLKEAECYAEKEDLLNAARATEQAAAMLREQRRLPEAVRCMEKACGMYAVAGDAVPALERAGRLAEAASDPAKAAELYQKAAGALEAHRGAQRRPRQAAELLGRAARLLLRLRRLDEVAGLLTKEKGALREAGSYAACFKRTVAQVLVHLHRGDAVGADACVRDSYSLPGYAASDDCLAMETLLQAFNERDHEQVCQLCSSPLLRSLDSEYSRLALTLKFLVVPPQQPPTAAATDCVRGAVSGGGG